jgi:hypothetical protein
MRIWIASIAAVLVQPVVFMARIAPAFAASESLNGLGFVLLMVMAVGAAAVLFLGIPAFVLLHKYQQDSWVSLGILGFLLAALPVAVLSWPRRMEGYSAGRNWHGQYVKMYVDGTPTDFAWLAYVEDIAFFGLHGLIGALVFYVVWRKLGGSHSSTDSDSYAVGHPKL